jgi:hypothetical protein
VLLLLAALLMLLLLLSMKFRQRNSSQPCPMLTKVVLNISLQLVGYYNSYLELPIGTLTIIQQLQHALALAAKCITEARQHQFADEATCARWMQHANDVISSSGALTVPLVQ